MGGFLVAAALLALLAVLLVDRSGDRHPTEEGMLLEGGSSLLCVEMADTETKREIGLSERTEIGAFDGMAFVSSAEALQQAVAPATATRVITSAIESGPPLVTTPFWMKNTLIPLDVAYVGGDARVNEVQRMEPCTVEPCRLYPPGEPYLYAIEFPAGWAGQFGITPGRAVRLGEACVPFDRD